MTFPKLIARRHHYYHRILGAFAWLLVLGLAMSSISACAMVSDAAANSTVQSANPAVQGANPAVQSANCVADATIQTHDFTPVSQAHTSAEYLSLVKQTLIDVEGVTPSLYDDGSHIPTIGIGYNLKVQPVLDAVVKAIGLDPAGLNKQEQQELKLYTDRITKQLTSFNPKNKNSQISVLSSNLNTIITDVHNDKVLPAPFKKNVSLSFSFKSQQDAIALLDTVYKNLGFEGAVSSVLRSSNFNDSLERMAILSLKYNGVSFNTLLGDIKKGDRAEAWYVIRYALDATNNSAIKKSYNPKNANGVATRRDYESDLFGLYNDNPFLTPSLVTNAEADQVFNMVLCHETTLFQSVLPVKSKPSFNNQYFVNPDAKVDDANNNYKNDISVITTATHITPLESNFAVHDLTDDFAPAANYLLTDAHATSVGNVLVYNQPGSQTQNTIDLTKYATVPVAVFLQNDGSTNQTIRMNAASDLIYSKANNTIMLGQGVDQLTLQGSTDTVDATGLNTAESAKNLPIDTITFGGQSIAGTIPQSGVYNDATYTLAGTTLTVKSGSDTLTIKGFYTGDFGVNIAQTQCTAPAKPNAVTNNIDTMFTQLLSPCPPPPSQASKVVFNGGNASFTRQLWSTDGTATGTQELTNVVVYYNSLDPTNITAIGNKAVFKGLDASAKNALWVTDGTQAGTKELTNIPNAASSGISPTDITAFGQQALFDGYDANGNDEIWITDGTAAGTKEITNIPTAGHYESTFGDITTFGNQALFNGYDASGSALWVTDGTPAGTHKLSVMTQNGLVYPTGNDITAFGNKVLFNGSVNSLSSELWITDGTTAGTQELSTTQPFYITTFGNQALFYGLDHNIWVTDGTPAGTKKVIDSSDNLTPTAIAAFGDKALFVGNHANDYGIWVTDGTTAGTQELTSLGTNYSTYSNDITAFGKQALFYGVDAHSISELWTTDGTKAGTKELTSITGNNFKNGLEPNNITVFGNKVLFNGYDANSNDGLWVTDGTSAGTQELTSIANSDTSGFGPVGMTVLK